MTNVADRSMGIALRSINRMAGSETLDRLRLRGPVEKALRRGTRDGFRAITVATGVFQAPAKRSGKAGARLEPTAPTGLFDLTPTEEQQMLVEAASAFAEERLRPAAAAAERELAPAGLLAEATELGLAMLGVPESAGGAVSERSAVTGALVTEALAYGDPGLTVLLLAPAAVATAIAAWGDADQQQQYLPPLLSDEPPVAALALAEPRALADPLAPATVATPIAGGYELTGVKALVPRATDCALLVVGATIPGHGPALFLVETGADGVSAHEDDRAMGLHGARLGRIQLDRVTLSEDALLANADPQVYRECVARSQIAWAAVASGATRAVRDFVSGYVNERVAFGEPISHRQAVAFTVSNIAIEHEGLRLVMLRAAARADAGRDFHREAALARSLADRYGSQIGSDGVQLLGGHGYIDEYPVERWYRDLRACGTLDGIVLI